MNKKDHHQLVARLATSNISTEDFSYLTTELMETRTCENCKHYEYERCNIITQDVWSKIDADNILVNIRVDKDFGCNKWETKDSK